MKGLYDVDSIANFMVVYANKIKKPISNLQLQKFLYFLWIEYYKKYKKVLFDTEFWAWRFGPVVPEVYYRFCVYGGLPITENINTDLKDVGVTQGAEKIIERYSDVYPFDLVEKTHHKDGAWDLVFNKNGTGTGNRVPIPFSLIIDRECSDNG